jgi:MFS transporter, FSR family, fosmidomycin resistance protein
MEQLQKMSRRSALLSMAFSCIAHSYSHLFAPIFFVVVLSLEHELGLTHGETVSLILMGSILFGIAAPLAGWLGDRWSAVGMITLFFFGTGGGMILTGLSDSPFGIGLWLAVTGLFASIYHPVGMAWLVRNAVNRGAALGVNGMFGGFGPAAAAVMSGAIIDLFGWRSAFVMPGVLVVLTGCVFLYLIARGEIVDSRGDRAAPLPPPSRDDTRRVIMVLALTMICNGLIYQASQAGLPKLFEERLFSFATDETTEIGLMVGAVYLTAGVLQIFAGRLADRYPLKTVYRLAFLAQAPFLLLASQIGGVSLAIVAMAMATTNSGTLPAENCLVARYAPSHHRGLAYGLKFVIALGIGSLGIKMEGLMYDATGGFFWLFIVLGSLAITASLIGYLLPTDHRVPVSAPAE